MHATPPHEEKKWMGDGASRVHYRIVRAARESTLHPRAPVLLLHGLASNLTRWSEFVAHTSLTKAHDVIRVDLRGHGESIMRHTFSLETWRDDLAAILAAEFAKGSGSAPPAIVIGHSLGAQAALFFAAHDPTRVAGLVLIDPIFREAVLPAKQGYVGNGPLYSFAAKVIRAANRMGIHRGALPPLDLHALDLKAREALASTDANAVEKFVAQYSSTRADLKHIPHANYLQDMVEMFRALPNLSSINAPVLALRSTVAGYQDDAIVERRLREMPRVEIQAIACHHWPLTERPTEVRTAIETFIQQRIDCKL